MSHKLHLLINKDGIGHVGIALETPQKEVRFFDFGVIGMACTKKNSYSKTFNTLAGFLPVLTAGFYASIGLATAHFIGAGEGVVLAGEVCAATLGATFGMSAGIWAENDMPSKHIHNRISIDINQETFTRIMDYIKEQQNSGIDLYSLGLRNCVTQVKEIMELCGYKFSGFLNKYRNTPKFFEKDVLNILGQGPAIA